MLIGGGINPVATLQQKPQVDKRSQVHDSIGNYSNRNNIFISMNRFRTAHNQLQPL